MIRVGSWGELRRLPEPEDLYEGITPRAVLENTGPIREDRDDGMQDWDGPDEGGVSDEDELEWQRHYERLDRFRRERIAEMQRRREMETQRRFEARWSDENVNEDPTTQDMDWDPSDRGEQPLRAEENAGNAPPTMAETNALGDA